jgi:hypothetical protein
MAAMESMISFPEKRLPDFEKTPDIAHPDIFLNIPSLTNHTPVLNNRSDRHLSPELTAAGMQNAAPTLLLAKIFCPCTQKGVHHTVPALRKAAVNGLLPDTI